MKRRARPVPFPLQVLVTLAVAGLLFVIMAGGCASSGRPADYDGASEPIAQASDPVIVINVTNNGRDEVTFYLINGQVPVKRFGLIGMYSSRSWLIPRSQLVNQALRFGVRETTSRNTWGSDADQVLSLATRSIDVQVFGYNHSIALSFR